MLYDDFDLIARSIYAAEYQQGSRKELECSIQNCKLDTYSAERLFKPEECTIAPCLIGYKYELIESVISIDKA